jgi:DNA-binding response OmpR family regulator
LQTAHQRGCHIFPSGVGEESGPLDGEDIATSHWEDARHWMSIYADLIEFKIGILDRVRRDVSKLPPVARTAAEADVLIIESQMHGYQKRLELWHLRLSDLNGPELDPQTRMIRFKGAEAPLTVREFQLLELLLGHPYRYFTVPQILDEAWAQPNLFPEQARSYVARLRAIFIRLEIPCDIVNRPGRGYSLEFRAAKQPG